MPNIPTPEELGGLLRMPGSRPIGRYDVSPFAQGAQQIADAGARLGHSIEDVGKATYKLSRQQAMTEAVNNQAVINARLIEARSRYRNDPDFATLPQRWAEEAGGIVDDGLGKISDSGLREHVHSSLLVPLAQESAAIKDQAFRGAAAAHAVSREKYLNGLTQNTTLDPNDALRTAGVNSLHAAIDDAVGRGFLTPGQAAEEKRHAALALCAGEYSQMARVDPQRAIQELESSEDGHPLLAHLPQPQKDALIREAQRRQDGAQADSARGTALAQQQAQRASDEAEHATIKDLFAGNPSVTSDAILGNPTLKDDAKDRMLGAIARSAQPEPAAEGSRAAAWGLIDRIRLEHGDEEKIVGIAPIVDAYNAGKLRKADFEFLTKQLAGAQTPEGDAIAPRRQDFTKSVEPLTDIGVLTDPDGGGSTKSKSQLYLLERDLDQKIDRYRQDGRDPFDLFDPSKPEYVGKPEALLPYVDRALIQIASNGDHTSTADTTADKQTEGVSGVDSPSADFGPFAELLTAFRGPQEASAEEPIQAGIPRIGPKIVLDALRWLWSQIPKLPPRTANPPPRPNQLPLPPILPLPPSDPTLEHLQRVDTIVERIGNSVKEHPLRQAYENEVRGLEGRDQELIQSGASEEARARNLNQARRDIGEKYKDLTPDALREYIYEVNKQRYRDPLGPTYDFLKAEGRTDADIIAGAKRPNPDVDRLLSNFKNWLRSQDPEKVRRWHDMMK